MNEGGRKGGRERQRHNAVLALIVELVRTHITPSQQVLADLLKPTATLSTLAVQMLD